MLGMFLVSVGTSVHCYCEEKEINDIRFAVQMLTYDSQCLGILLYIWKKRLNIRTITCYRTLYQLQSTSVTTNYEVYINHIHEVTMTYH